MYIGLHVIKNIISNLLALVASVLHTVQRETNQPFIPVNI